MMGLLAYGLSKRWINGRGFVLSRRVADRSVVILAIIYFIIFGTLTLLLHFSLNGADDDVGLFHQVVWNSLHGRLLETSLLSDVTSLIQQRFSPILLAFVPWYAVWTSPAVLLLIQTLGIAVGVFPLYWIARAKIGNGFGVLLAAVYFLFPALEHVNLYGFHEIALAIPVLAYACFFLLRKRLDAFFICVLLSLLIKEDLALTAAGLGVYLFLVLRKRWLGLILCFGSIAWFVFLLQWLIPFFRGAPEGYGYYYFGSGFAAGFGRYDYLGNSLSQIILTILTRPDLVVSHLFVERKIDYLINLLVPLGLLPFVGLEIAALAIPSLAISVLSDYPLQTSLASHYAAPTLVPLFFAVPLAIERLIKLGQARNEKFARALGVGVLLILASLANYYLLSPGPLARNFKPEKYAVTARTFAGYELLSKIPADAVVVAQRGLVLHISGRAGAHEFPGSPDFCREEYVIVDETQYAFQAFQDDWQKYMRSGYFEIAQAKEGFILASRRVANRPSGISFGNQLTLANYLLITDSARGGSVICPIVEWRAARAIPGAYIIHARLVDSRGHVIARDDREPRRGLLPTNRWTSGQSIPDQFTFDIPSTAPSGMYAITVGVYDPVTDRYLEPRDANGTALDYEAPLATLKIQKDVSSKTASELYIENPLMIDMGEIRLLGLASLPKTIEPGQRLAVGLYWRARAQPRGDYHVQVTLKNAADITVLEKSSAPAAGTYPTSQWHMGEVLLDWHDLDLPSDLESGEYRVMVYLRDSAKQIILGQAQVALIKIEN